MSESRTAEILDEVVLRVQKCRVPRAAHSSVEIVAVVADDESSLACQ